LALLGAKEWPQVFKVPSLEGIQKGGSGRSYAAVLRSVVSVDEKMMRLKSMSTTPLDLPPLVLAKGGEEV
jgi:hypothetical protein